MTFLIMLQLLSAYEVSNMEGQVCAEDEDKARGKE
jgi:hypothetical protein